MTTLVVGASGATGQQLVKQLLIQGEKVKIIVRTTDHLSDTIKAHANLSIIQASLLELSDCEIAQHAKGCDAIASCLGHNLTFKGVYGHPRRLVTDAVHRLCTAIKANKPESAVKFILMNTTGNRNQAEPISFAQTCVIGLIRLLIPPHADNEEAADYLRKEIGQNNSVIQWVAVRPDTLVNEDKVSEYEVYPSPIRSAIFDAGKTSRINVGSFMANLILNDKTWKQWQGKMPVIYNTEDM